MKREFKCSVCGKKFYAYRYGNAVARRCSWDCEIKFRKILGYKKGIDGRSKRKYFKLRKFSECVMCGVEIPKWNKGHLRKYCSNCHKPRFNKSKNFLESLRTSGEYVNWRLSVYSRDKGICHVCKKKCRKDICAHHIKSFKVLVKEAILLSPMLDKSQACLKHAPLWEVSNGITICRKCHGEIHSAQGHKERWG